MKARPSKQSGEVILEVGRRDEPLLAAGAAAQFRIKSILVPVDFSECSRKALQYAAPLATQHQAEITLLFVMGAPTYGTGEFTDVNYAALESEMRAGSEARLQSLAEEELHGAVPFKTLVHLGSAGAEIVAVAKSMPADLIVISTHGHSGLKHLLLGSVAEDVVRRAPCPVLVVREREREFVSK